MIERDWRRRARLTEAVSTPSNVIVPVGAVKRKSVVMRELLPAPNKYI